MVVSEFAHTRRPPPPPLIFINSTALALAQRLRRCLRELLPWQLHEASSQYLFEVDMLDALESHPQRTDDPAAATVEYLPLLAVAALKFSNTFASQQARQCERGAGRSHVRDMLRSLREQPPSRLPLVYTHVSCCRLQPDVNAQTNIFGALQTERTRRCVVQLAKSPAAREPNTVTVVVPYSTSASPVPNATCGAERPRRAPPLYYAGCHCTVNHSTQASRVRTHLRSLALAAPALLWARFTTRAHNVTGDGQERRAPPAHAAGAEGLTLKQRSLAEMQLPRACLVPEGDSPESSRLFDAVSALCVPVVIRAGLPVPLSAHGAWRLAAVVLHPQAVLLMRHASQLVEAVEGEIARRGVGRVCRAQRLLRSDMRAESVASLLGRELVAGCTAGTPGHAVLSEVLSPSEPSAL